MKAMETTEYKLRYIRPSRHKAPEHAHPFVKRIYKETLAQRVLIKDLAKRSGVHISVLREWKRRCKPKLEDIEAVLNVLGLELTIKERGDDD